MSSSERSSEEIKTQFNAIDSPHYLDKQEFSKNASTLLDVALQFAQQVDEITFYKDRDPQTVETKISEKLPQTGEEIPSIIDTLQSEILPLFPSTSNKHFLGYVPADAAPEAQLGSMASSIFNQFTGTVQGSPGATAIEGLVIQWIAKMLDLPEQTFGSFTIGGSGANKTCIYTGMVVKAREYGINIKEDGVNPDRRFMIYTSKEAHNSIEKALLMLGLGRKSIRYMETNEQYQLTAETVEQQIRADKEKLGDDILPLMVIATAGTTNTGSIDRLEELNALCREYNLWFHIDAAYGGFAKIADVEEASQLNGIENADSIALDTHKWLFTPYEGGIALVADHWQMRQAYNLSAEYLEDTVMENDYPLQRNFRSYGFPLTRRFRGLKLWFLIKAYGMKELCNAIKRNIVLAQYLASRIEETEDFELMIQNLSVVCFQYKGSESQNQEIIAKIQERQYFFISSTKLEGKPILRACIINLRADIELMDQFIQELQDIVDKL